MSLTGEWTRNPVCTVRWAGWSADTLSLQRAGWQLAVQQDLSRRTVRLALQHPQGWEALTNAVDYSRVLPSLLGDASSVLARDARLLEFNVEAISSRVQVCAVWMPTDVRFTAVDAWPSTAAYSYNEQRLSDLVPFMPVNHAAEQVVVAPDSVPRVLELLLRCQEPAAAARRQRARHLAAQVLVAG